MTVLMLMLVLMMLLQRKEEEVLATGDETKQMLVRVERVGRICPGQFLANGSRTFFLLNASGLVRIALLFCCCF